MGAEQMRGNTVADLGLKHGHLLYASYQDKAAGSSGAAAEAGGGTAEGSTSTAAAASTTAAGKQRRPWEVAEEETIDAYWSAQEGKIARGRDAKFCRHGAQGMCDYCMPLEPYDARYQAEHNIKHLSYHAHLRKLNAGTNKQQGNSWIPPLDEADYSVKSPCPSGQHPDWPAGICTKCQPSAITLQRQTYRMVDHVEFSHPELIENLLKFWRSSASQRFGFLLGRYEAYDEVPMGIKAVVEAIHEPPQEPELDGVTVGVPWEEQGRIEALAKQAGGLQFVGMIYSDLTADTQTDEKTKRVTSSGKVLCKRHKDSFFLSGCEVLFAAALQNANSTPSRMSASGRFNSRFVTCVLTGNAEGEIGVEAYQVSEQAMAMVRADMIEASVNPNIIRVKPSDTAATRYVPEVFFRYKNEYGLDVKESAKPTFPVEYLIVNVTNGFPTKAAPRFLSSAFPIENRQGLSDQSTDVLFQQLLASGAAELQPGAGGEKRRKAVEWLSDWHLLAFLQTTGLVGEEEMRQMIAVAIKHEQPEGLQALDALLASPGWQTLVTIAKESAPRSSGGGSGGGGGWGGNAGDALDDELTPEEIAAIIASNEADQAAAAAASSSSSSRGAGALSAPQAGSSSRTSSRKPSPPRTTSRPGASSSLNQSSTAILPVDQALRRQPDEFEYTGEDDYDPEAFDFESGQEDDDDDDDEVEFDDAEEDVVEVEPQAPARSTRTTAAPAAPPASASRSQVMDLTGDSDDENTAAAGGGGGGGSSGQIACPTCTVLNDVGTDTCYLCGLPMSGA